MTSGQETYLAQFNKLTEQSKTLILSTLDESGLPHASYSPCYYNDAEFYIYVSDLAAHSHHLKQNSMASVMLIEDESSSQNLYARHRMTARCDVKMIGKNENHYEMVMEQLEKRIGKTVNLLRNLSDFNLFRLHFHEARMVIGFGETILIRIQTAMHQNEDRVQLHFERLTADKLNND